MFLNVNSNNVILISGHFFNHCKFSSLKVKIKLIAEKNGEPFKEIYFQFR